MEIKVTYSSIDRCRDSRTFKTLKGAQAFAHKMIGAHPDCGSSYAVSFDGIGKITVDGATIGEIFPDTTGAPKPAYRCTCSEQQKDLVGCDCAMNTEDAERYSTGAAIERAARNNIEDDWMPW